MSDETRLHGLVDCTNEQYHSGPGISKSKLDAIAISPLNYWDKYINPDREPEEFKHCFAIGDGTHRIVLEPGTFEEKYAVGFDKSAYPNALDTTADMKAELAKGMFMQSGTKPELMQRLIEEADYPADNIMMYLQQKHAAAIADKIEIPAKDYKNMMGMLAAINSHHTAAGILQGASVEQSFYWTDDHGVLRKCRTDAISANGQFVVDLKTTDFDVSASAFGRTIMQRRYEVQAAWYLDILQALYGKDAPQTFVFVVVQKSRPFDVSVQYLTREQIDIGRILYLNDYTRLLECERDNYWPGMDGGEVLQAELPGYHMMKVMHS